MRFRDIKQNLVESRGISARTQGDVYFDPTNPKDEIVFQEFITLPVNGIKYDDVESRDFAIEKFIQKNPGNYHFLNTPNQGQLGIMIAAFLKPKGRKMDLFVRFSSDVANVAGKMGQIDPGVMGPGHGGYKFKKETSISENLGIKPSQVIKSAGPFSINELPELLGQVKTPSNAVLINQMQGYLSSLLQGEPRYVIRGGAEYITSHQKYLGEWGAPIALAMGLFDPQGTAERIETEVLAGQSLADGQVMFPKDVSQTLFDSSMKYGAEEILISSKAHKGGGAAASLKGLYDIVTKKGHLLPDDYTTNEEFVYLTDVLKTIAENSTEDGMLQVAMKQKVISKNDYNIMLGISAARKKGQKIEWADALPVRVQALMLTQIKADKGNRNYSPFFHALASIAKATTNELNKYKVTDYIRGLLNFSSIVQMYFDVKPRGEDAEVMGFRIVWPPTFAGIIVFDASKNFTSSEDPARRGKLGFKIK